MPFSSSLLVWPMHSSFSQRSLLVHFAVPLVVITLATATLRGTFVSPFVAHHWWALLHQFVLAPHVMSHSLHIFVAYSRG